MAARTIDGPTKDWLSKGEVCAALEVSEGTLDGMISRGEFPRPVAFRGENRARWRWVDVCWYMLGREVSDRLVSDPAEEPAPAEGQPNPKRGQPAPKSG